MKIKISFSDEETEEARRLADMIRRMFPQIDKAKETKKPEQSGKPSWQFPAFVVHLTVPAYLVCLGTQRFQRIAPSNRIPLNPEVGFSRMIGYRSMPPYSVGCRSIVRGRFTLLYVFPALVG